MTGVQTCALPISIVVEGLKLELSFFLTKSHECNGGLEWFGIIREIRVIREYEKKKRSGLTLATLHIKNTSHVDLSITILNS